LYKLKTLGNARSVHFIGIGGVSMIALARMLAAEGYTVSGSDQKDFAGREGLQKCGIAVSIGHAAENLPENCDIVVYNSAVPADNPEFAHAKSRGIRLMARAALLGAAMRGYPCPICVAGTHGKTSTTSMLAAIFLDAGQNPMVHSGGILPKIGSTLHLGAPPYFIAESCEYFENFLQLFPKIGIILNMDYDHADFYPDFTAMRNSFRRFAELIPSDGALVINANIPDLENFIAGLDCRVITFGAGGEFEAQDIRNMENMRCVFELTRSRRHLGDISMGVIGAHNVENALAAIACAHFCGLSIQQIDKGLAGYEGCVRRFQKLGEYRGCPVIDDYAHHPTEIAASIAAAKTLSPRRVVTIFQPHTRTRTAEFLTDFAKSLATADIPIVLDIYEPIGREEHDCQIHAKDLAAAINKAGRQSLYLPTFAAAADHLDKIITKGDLIITMGAGDVYKLGNMFVANL